MIFGYARVSRKDQNLQLQIDALKKYDCQEIFSDRCSGAKAARPEFDKLRSKLRDGDVIVVWKLDRIGRSFKHLVNLSVEFFDMGVNLISISDGIDTTKAHGKLIFNLLAVLAEFERDLIIERTHAGLAAARARGRNGGRPKGLTKNAQIKARAVETYYKEGMPVKTIAEQLNISRTTCYRYLEYRKVKIDRRETNDEFRASQLSKLHTSPDSVTW